MRSWFLALALCACSRPAPPDDRAMAEGLYLAGVSAFAQGKLVEARARFEEVRQRQPADPRLPAAMGELALTEGKLAEAVEAYREATRRNPGRALNWSRLGGLLASRGDTSEAEAALRKALRLDPNDSDAHEQLATLLLKKGDFDGAAAGVTRAAQLAPPSQTESVLLAGAGALRKAGQPEVARRLLAEAVSAGPRGAELWAELGDLEVRAGNLERGKVAYERAARQDDRDPTLWEIVGELEVKRGRPAEAIAAFRESLRRADRATVHLALARLALARGELASADVEVASALARATGEARESRELAELLEKVGRPGDALRLLRTLLDDPAAAADPELFRALARLSRQTGDTAGLKAACAAARDAGVTPCP